MSTFQNGQLARFHQRLKTIAGNASGVALIEFAMVVPILIVLFIGGFQLMEATSVYRKVTTTARSLSDLSTQYISEHNTNPKCPSGERRQNRNERRFSERRID